MFSGTLSHIVKLIENHQSLAYVILFLGVIVEGEFVLIISGILAHLGAINILGILPLVFFGAITKTISWYYLGFFLNKFLPKNKLVKFLEKKVFYFLPNFRGKPFWSIFISKFIIGVNHIVLVLAGFFKVKFKTYFKAEFFSSILWVPIMFFLGYFFSYTALSLTKDLRKFIIIVALFIFGFLILEKIITFFYELYESFMNKEEINKEE